MSRISGLNMDVYSGSINAPTKIIDGDYLLPIIIMNDNEINNLMTTYGNTPLVSKTVDFSDLNNTIITDLDTALGTPYWNTLGALNYKWTFSNYGGRGYYDYFRDIGGWPREYFPVFSDILVDSHSQHDIHFTFHNADISNSAIRHTTPNTLSTGLINCGINTGSSTRDAIDIDKIDNYIYPITGSLFDCAGYTGGIFKFAFALNIMPEQFVVDNKLSFNGGGYGYVFGVMISAPKISSQVSIPTAEYTISYYMHKISLTAAVRYELEGAPIPGPSPDNPYEGGGTSGSGGGGGNFDDSSDPVDFSPLPTLSAAQAGLISLFNPSLSELRSLSSRLWSTDFLDAIVNFFSDPSDLIISLGIVPVPPPLSGRAELQAGLISTGVEMNVIGSQFMTYDCGSVTIEPYYGAALDYAPYTKVSVFLPYIGVRQLNTDEVMGSSVAIRYNIDLFSGACTAQVKVGSSVLYTYNGNVVSQIPVSARSYDSLISAVINGATAIGGAIATGGATANTAISATVNAVQAAKPEVLRSGNASANIGLLAGQTPYLIFEIPRQSMPKNNQTYVGYPSNITATLGDLTGYTQVETIHLENIPATNGELNEIENLLREGVIL